MVYAVVGGIGRRAPASWGGFLLGGALLGVLAGTALAADEVRGEAEVVSGNEIVIGKKTVRLFGMSAPGLKDICEVNSARIKCGIVAWAVLIQLADGQFVSCDREQTPAGAQAADKTAFFATCYLGETDLNEAMVRSGWASTVPAQTDRYEVDETDAKESGRGLWAQGGKGN